MGWSVSLRHGGGAHRHLLWRSGSVCCETYMWLKTICQSFCYRLPPCVSAAYQNIMSIFIHLVVHATNGQGCLETDQDNPCSFNAGRCCGIAASRRTDDISVLRAIIDWCHSTLNTDRKAFLSGFSNGGMLANRAACEMSDRVRAVAPVGAALEYSIEFPACTPETPVPYVGLCGAADSYCNFFREASETWAIQNGCNYRSSHVSYATATTTCRTFDGCTAATEWCMVENLGHRWPGHALPSRSRVQNANNIDATFHIMQRFAAMVDVQYDTDLPADA
eukprot:m.625226 g.625226  ORF g.625226 m.625226 type:complete len:278 (-) comp22547_c0_seq8:1117-1950(-)